MLPIRKHPVTVFGTSWNFKFTCEGKTVEEFCSEIPLLVSVTSEYVSDCPGAFSSMALSFATCIIQQQHEIAERSSRSQVFKGTCSMNGKHGVSRGARV